MRAYVQQVRESDSIYLPMVEAAHWFDRRGYEVIRFEYADVAKGALDEDLLHHVVRVDAAIERLRNGV